MSEATAGVVILVAISVTVSALFHALIRSYPLASVVAAAVSSVLFNLYVIWDNGEVDAFLGLALIGAFLWALAVSLLTAIPFIRRRRSSRKPS